MRITVVLEIGKTDEEDLLIFKKIKLIEDHSEDCLNMNYSSIPELK